MQHAEEQHRLPCSTAAAATVSRGLLGHRQGDLHVWLGRRRLIHRLLHVRLLDLWLRPTVHLHPRRHEFVSPMRAPTSQQVRR